MAQSSTNSKTLLGFDSINYLLPDGLAVVESQITLSNLQVAGNPEIGVWELIQPNWRSARSSPGWSRLMVFNGRVQVPLDPVIGVICSILK